MSDFGGSAAYDEAPPFLSTYSGWSGVLTAKQASGGQVAAATVSWGTANQARYYPMSLPFAYLVRRVWWINGSSAASNVDFGIYTPDGAKIYSTGSTAQSGASLPQFVDATDFWLYPGEYYFAFNCSGTANAVWGQNTGFIIQRHGGILQQAVGAVTLPSPATFATPTVAGINMCGVTWTDSGF